MDHKSWLWRKKSTEKAIVAADKVNLSLKENEEETLLNDKAELEKELKSLNDKLSSALSECEAKDDLVKEHAKTAQEATAGREKVEGEVVTLRRELDEVLRQRVAGEERLTHLDAALKECMKQLCFVRDEQEQRIHDAVTKTSREFENAQKVLEEKLAETSKMLAKAGVENTQLSKALLMKEKLIEDLNKQKTRAEADFNALMTRLDSNERDNTSLKYEVRVLEKELEIRNEEREFNRRTADASHKQHLESVKKIAKLESECQRLRLLVRKRLPGPAALAKMKNEVEMLGKDSFEMRTRKVNPSTTGLPVDSAGENFPHTPSKRINHLMEQLCTMEEENKTLKEALNKKANELQFSRTMYARTASKLTQVESQLLEPRRGSFVSHELSLTSVSDLGSDDKVSCAESWASAFISESKHFRNGKQKGSPSCKTVGAPDMNLMDDFVEMEKLAIVTVDKPSGSSCTSADEANAIIGPLETDSKDFSSEITGREIVPVSDSQASSCVSNQEINSKDMLTDKSPGWLQDVLKLVLEQNCVTQRNPDDILDFIRVALAHVKHQHPSDFFKGRENSNSQDTTNPSLVSSCVSCIPENKSSVMVASNGVSVVDISLAEKSNQQFQSDLSKSICKIIELIEGISLPSLDYDKPENLSRKNGSLFSYKNPETPTGYMVRVFQWKTSELKTVLHQVVQTCYDHLSGKADVNKIAQELTSALDWIMNHCFSLQDVSSMKDAIKNRYDWDESRSGSEAEVGITGQFSADKLGVPRDQLSGLPMAAAPNGQNILYQAEELQSNVREENRKLKVELMNVESSAKGDLERRLRSTIDKSNSLLNQLQESEKTIKSLQTELETLKEPKGKFEHQIENHKLLNEDLDTQYTVAKVELNEARQKISSLEMELENKNNCCEELEATCLELQLQIESVTKTETLSNDLNHEGKQLRTDWEITAASEKLAECQETILNLGKQLKALASPKEAVLFDKVISTPTDTVTTAATTITQPGNKNTYHRSSSLLDKMLAEDNERNDHRSLKIKESDGKSGSAVLPNVSIWSSQKYLDHDVSVGSLAIVPIKKHQGGGGLWGKLLWRRKKGSGKKTSGMFVPNTHPHKK